MLLKPQAQPQIRHTQTEIKFYIPIYKMIYTTMPISEVQEINIRHKKRVDGLTSSPA